MSNENVKWYKRTKFRLWLLAFVFITVYIYVTAVKGPFKVLIEAPGEDGYFVAKFVIIGPTNFGSGHEIEVPRFTLYEETKVVKANELFEFPRVMMWMGLTPNEYRLYLYQPGYFFRDAPYYFTLFPEGEIQGDSVNRIVPRSWQNYLDEGEKVFELVQISPGSAFWAKMGRLHGNYIPAVGSALGREATWQQLKRLIDICRVIYEENEETPDGYCNERYIKMVLKWGGQH